MHTFVIYINAVQRRRLLKLNNERASLVYNIRLTRHCCDFRQITFDNNTRHLSSVFKGFFATQNCMNKPFAKRPVLENKLLYFFVPISTTAKFELVLSGPKPFVITC